MLGQEREGNVFEPLAFPGVRMKYCPGFGWEGVGTRCDLLSGLEVRLWERPRLTLLWYAGARPSVRIDRSRCRRLSAGLTS